MNANVYTREMKIIGAVLLQLAVILFMILFKVSVLQGGTDIALRIAPVDPRDPLRGDYVTFSYDISRVYTGSETFANGEEVFVPLRQAGKYHVVYGSPVKRLPTASLRDGDILYLKGVVTSGGRSDIVSSTLDAGRWGGDIWIKYGIEEYFIPEGTGQRMNFWNRESFARVAVDDRGNAVLKQLYVDDQPWP